MSLDSLSSDLVLHILDSRDDDDPGDDDEPGDDAPEVDHVKARLVRQAEGAIARATGRRYQVDLDALDQGSLRELLRLLRDLEQEKAAAVRRARMFPWRG